MANSSEKKVSPEVRVAYIFGGFPYFSQVFNLEEIKGLLERGLDLLVFSVIRPRGYQSVISHSSYSLLEDAIIYGPSPLSSDLWKSQLHYLARKPLLYLWLYFYIVLGHGLRLKTMLKTMAFMPTAFHFARLMEERGVSRIHAGMSRYAATYAMVISRITGLPFSFTMHGPKSFLNGAMHSEKIRNATCVTTISEFNKKLIGEFTDDMGMKKVHVVRIGIDTDRFSLRRSAVERGGFSVLSVARMDRDKGLDILISAAAYLKNRVDGLSLTLVGDGPLRGELEDQAAELGISGIVRFTGAIEQEDVRNEYARADVFVLPSFWEGIPVVLMEAMAVGVPVVATRITGIPELINDGENGLLVPTGRSEAVAQAILKLYDDRPLVEKFIMAGRRKVEQEYSTRQRAERLYTLFTNGCKVRE
jgi:glycosyltransferase involved in cell wall biosynthesis